MARTATRTKQGERSATMDAGQQGVERRSRDAMQARSARDAMRINIGVKLSKLRTRQSRRFSFCAVLRARPLTETDACRTSQSNYL
jgi:hypothetical protein